MKKFQFVKVENNDMEDNKYLLIESELIEKTINFTGDSITCKIDKELTDAELEKLQNWYIEKLDNDELDTIMYEYINDYFKVNNINNKATDIKEVEEYCKQPVLYLNSGIYQDNLNYYDWQYTYTYWDGHNWKTLWLDDINEDEGYNDGDVAWVSLDEWNGRNHSFGGMASHAEVGKWGEKYLIKEWTQYQGDHTYITILENRECLENWFEERETEIPEGIL